MTQAGTRRKTRILSMSDINFRSIRPFGSPPSQPGGFEQFTCMLLEDAWDWPSGTVFARFGNPDGGREGRATLPDGRVCAWQTKYLFAFDYSASRQVEQSFQRTLETEPNLSRYLVVLPIDLSAGDTGERRSAQTHWNAKAEEWTEQAAQSGRTVEIEFVGQHQLVKALLTPTRAIWARYWFDESFMNSSWFEERTEVAVAKAGRRYSPELHTEVEAIYTLEGVGRTKAFQMRWRRALGVLRKSQRSYWPNLAEDCDEIHDAAAACKTSLEEADSAICSLISSLKTLDDLPLVVDYVHRARQDLERLLGLLYTHDPEEDQNERTARHLRYGVQQTFGALLALSELAESGATQAANSRELLIAGAAGAGKTHLLCDVARKRTDAGLPTILVMGQDFDRRALRNQIPELTSFDRSVEDEVAALALASEAAGAMGLLMIDALNESERPESWTEELRALRQIVSRHNQVALVVTCRSEFLSYVIGKTSMPTVEHNGFGESTETAIMRFAEEYGLNLATYPVLRPEFSNPLFLKLACEALATLGSDHFTLGSAGLTTICDTFLEAVNLRLSSPTRCDYNRDSHLVQKAVRVLAEHCFDTPAIERAETERLVGDLLIRERWSESLLKGLLDEGVLLRVPAGITFGYQRLGDVARASLLCAGPAEQIKEWVDGLGYGRWAYRGVLEVLAVILPEMQSIELVQLLAADNDHDRFEDVEMFVSSLSLRATSAVTDEARCIVRQLLDSKCMLEAVCAQLVQLSWMPGHPLNAQWTHDWLVPQQLAERDARWSLSLIGQTDSALPTGRLISWVRDRNQDTEPEIRWLAGLILGWMLTTSDNRVRDKATKALVRLFEVDPSTASETLRAFHGVNDPYVLERLTGAACGAALRLSDTAGHHDLATGIAELLGTEWPTHLLTRDYAHRVFELALTTGWLPPLGADPAGHPYSGPPYRAEFPNPTRTFSEIDTMSGPPDSSYSSIYFSLGKHGDFGRYVVSWSISKLAVNDGISLFELAQQAIFDRVLNLGWSPEAFEQIDRRLQSGPIGVPGTERIGKKYQWIGFYELLGQLADHLMLDDRSGDEQQVQYRYPEQLVFRDIDPTLIAGDRFTTDEGESRYWFSPELASFEWSQTGQQPRDLDGIPDPLTLIAVQDPSGSPWLVLETHPQWHETLLPEEKAIDLPHGFVWLQIRSYLTRTEHLPAIRDWAHSKDWNGRWMPESVDIHTALLAVHPDDLEWEPASGTIEDWEFRGSKPPCTLQLTTARYGGTGGERDRSTAERVTGFTPSRRLDELLDLSRAGDFAWKDPRGGIIVMDPSVANGGPSSLVASRGELISRLASDGLTILWTVLVGKDLIEPFAPRTTDQRWISASAAYALDDREVVRVSATAQLEGPYQGQMEELPWDSSLRERG